MNRIEGDQEGDHNLSNKYMTFDENGKAIDNVGGNKNQNTGDIPGAVEYSVIYQASSDKEQNDDKYVQIVDTRSAAGNTKVTHNITTYGAAYVLPNNLTNDEDKIEDYEKYR